LITNFDWSAEIEDTKEEINHALLAEIIEESVLDNNYIDSFDLFKEFFVADVENVGVVDKVEDSLRKEGKDEDEVAEMVLDFEKTVHSDLVCEIATNKEEKPSVNIGNRAEIAGTVAETVDSQLHMETVIEKAKQEAVDEYKRNTPYSQCDRALAAEKQVIGLPYEIVEEMCSSACKIRLIGIYKANKLLMTNENELKKTNRELKENESKFFC